LLSSSPLHFFTRPITPTQYREFQQLPDVRKLKNSHLISLDNTPRIEFVSPTDDYFIASLFAIEKQRFWMIGAYDEKYAEFEHGPEDMDICSSFVKAPEPRFVCIDDTACYHLWHPPATTDEAEIKAAWKYFHTKYHVERLKNED